MLTWRELKVRFKTSKQIIFLFFAMEIWISSQRFHCRYLLFLNCSFLDLRRQLADDCKVVPFKPEYQLETPISECKALVYLSLSYIHTHRTAVYTMESDEVTAWKVKSPTGNAVIFFLLSYHHL